MTARFTSNPFHRAAAHFGATQQEAYDPHAAAEARALLRQWPMHRETPLHDCAGVARHLGVARVWIKDEGQRLPLKSFKSLGGAFALGEFLRDQLAVDGRPPSYERLFDGSLRDRSREFTVASATDGNHGRSLAWGASLFGAKCHIYLPAAVSAERERAIADFGAQIVRVEGNYDAAVQRAREDARKNGWVFLQDTSTAEDTAPHKLIMHGYSLMADEIDLQLQGQRPTHLFLQVGCGGMAASVTAHLWNAWGASLPRIILVQSERADAVVQSFETGRHVVVGGNHDTIMIGIACGEVAHLCWPLLEPSAYGAMAIDDRAAVQAMRLVADTRICPQPIVMGETGAAGLAALSIAARDVSLRERLGLERDSRVLLINSEGDTDPARYRLLLTGDH